jgi:hypothetical protein
MRARLRAERGIAGGRGRPGAVASSGLTALLARLEPERARLRRHPVHRLDRTIESLYILMRFDVVAVWSSTCLASELQRRLACATEGPRSAMGSACAQGLVDDLVAASGARLDLYLGTLDDLGARTAGVRRLWRPLGRGVALDRVLASASTPPAARQFAAETTRMIDACSTVAIAGAVAFGGADVVQPRTKAVSHIASQRPTAPQLLEVLCGRDGRLWREAEDSGRRTITSTCRLWDAALSAVRPCEPADWAPRWWLPRL